MLPWRRSDPIWVNVARVTFYAVVIVSSWVSMSSIARSVLSAIGLAAVVTVIWWNYKAQRGEGGQRAVKE